MIIRTNDELEKILLAQVKGSNNMLIREPERNPNVVQYSKMALTNKKRRMPPGQV